MIPLFLAERSSTYIVPIRRIFVLCLLLWLGAATASERPGIARIERFPVSASVPENATLPQLQAAAFIPHQAGNLLKLDDARGTWWRITPIEPITGAVPSIQGLTAETERLLTVYNAYAIKVTVRSAPDYRPRTQTNFDPNLDLRYSRRALVFPLADEGVAPIYLYLGPGHADPPWVAVVATADYAVADLHYTRIIYTLQGMLATIALVVLLFWIRLRERVYLLFTLYVALELGYFMASSGEAFAVPGLRTLGAYGRPGVWLLTTLTVASSVFFINDFANLARLVPRLSRLLVISGFVLLAQAVALVLPWPSSKEWYPVVGNLTAPPIVLILLIALGLAAWRGGRDARYVLLAWAPPAVLIIARIAQIQSGLRYQTWLEFGLPLALAISAVVLTYGLAVRMLSFRHERDQALQHAELDPLTGAFNRSGGMRRLIAILKRTRKEQGALSLLFLDVDHFKRINDQFGHPHGDTCLQAMTTAVGRELRQRDVLARYGGEEFVVLLPGTALEHAAMVAERIRRRVELDCESVAGELHNMTVSIGVVSYDRGEDQVNDLIARGDAAMYRAKADGRNRVVVGRLHAEKTAFLSAEELADSIGKGTDLAANKAE